MNNAEIDEYVNYTLDADNDDKYKIGMFLLKEFKKGSSREIVDVDSKVVKIFEMKANRFYDLYLQEAAYKLLRLAANESHPDSIYEMGKRFEFGLGCAIDYDKAMQYYKRGMDLNHFPCMHALSNMYLEGKGVDVDESKAKEILFG